MPAAEIQADWAAQRIKNLSLFKAVVNVAPAQAEPEGDHHAHRGVPVPQVRAGDDVGALPRQGGRGQGSDGADADRGRRASSTTAVGPRGRGRRAPDGVDRLPGDHVISSMPIAQLLKAMDPPAPADVLAAADASATATSSPSRWWCPRRRLPGQLDLHPRARGQGRPHPELRLVVAVPGQGGPHLPRPRVLRLRGRRVLDMDRRGPGRAGHRSWSLGLVDPGVGRGRLRRADAQGVPVYDDTYKDNVDVAPGLARRPTRRTCTRRSQRHAQVQQPGPLDVHGHAHRGEHPRRHRPRHLGRERRGGVPRGEHRVESGTGRAAPVARSAPDPRTATGFTAARSPASSRRRCSSPASGTCSPLARTLPVVGNAQTSRLLGRVLAGGPGDLRPAAAARAREVSLPTAAFPPPAPDGSWPLADLVGLKQAEHPA